MMYFIKDNTIHTYPVAKRCTAIYRQEQLRDNILRGIDECPCCMRLWPNKPD